MDISDEEEIDKHCNELFALCEKFTQGISLDGLCGSFRYLRNTCALSSEHQNFIVSHANGLPCIVKLVDFVIISVQSTEERNICVRLGLQLLGNLTVNNEVTKKIVWEKCCKLLRTALYCDDEKSASYSAMVVYNIFLGKMEAEPWKELDTDFVSGLITSAVRGSEYGLFTLELLLKSEGWMGEYYTKLNSQQRYYILDLMSSSTSAINDDDATKESKKFHISAIRFISDAFCSHSDHILDTRTDCNGENVANTEALTQEQLEVDDPCEISKWLDVLASASGNEEYLHALQLDGPLLVQTVFLLKSIQLVGKLAVDEGDMQHPFAPLQKLSTVESSQLECSVEMHPAYGFKRNLIRLIGNLAWKNMEIQNKVLELDCVPLILECCNIDERNPFITQWAVMAIRNLCDGNTEVQKIIYGLKREGVISCDLLNEMGLTLHDSGNPNEKISVVPMPK